MTEQLVLDLLVSLGVVRIDRDIATKTFFLHCVRHGHSEVITVGDYKRDTLDTLHDLEEERMEVLGNRFTAPIEGEIGMGQENTTLMKVQYWKKDDQLSQEEQQEKQRRIAQLNKDIQNQHRIVDAMNYVQVHFNTLVHKLMPRTVELNGEEPLIEGRKVLWNKGLKPAALYCLRKYADAARDGKSELDVCREFIAHFFFTGDTQYTAEQLLNAAAQIRALDRAD
jgi:hypothetical protein